MYRKRERDETEGETMRKRKRERERERGLPPLALAPDKWRVLNGFALFAIKSVTFREFGKILFRGSGVPRFTNPYRNSPPPLCARPREISLKNCIGRISRSNLPSSTRRLSFDRSLGRSVNLRPEFTSPLERPSTTRQRVITAEMNETHFALTTRQM